MHSTSPNRQVPPREARSRVDSSSSYVAALGTREIFRQLIANEIRSGRLTPARRRRIVRYAASLGMSAVEAGELITACHKQIMESDDPAGRYHALRLVRAQPGRVPLALKISIVIVLAILLDLLLVLWL